jgi:hypothetical protein
MQLSRQSIARMFRLLKGGSILLFAVALSACKREQIRVYTVPKEKAVEVASSRGESAMPHLHYQTPEGWTEHEASGMRLVRLSAPARSGRNLDVSAITLPGTANPLDIVNLMRREQIGLQPIKEEEVDSLREKVEIGKSPGEMFDMVSAEPVLQDNQKARILIAMLKDKDVVWYFKMAGDDESVRNEKPKFLQFLKSIDFDYADHPASPSRFTSTNVKQVPRKTEPGAATKPVWEIPPDWKEAPPSPMLLAKFLVPGDGPQKAEVTVSVFPEDAGGVLNNVNRWRGQLGLASITAAELPSLTRPLEVPGTKAILVDMNGTDMKTGQKARLIAAILPQGDRTWFYKLMGDEQVAERQRETFVKFVQTAKHPNG